MPKIIISKPYHSIQYMNRIDKAQFRDYCRQVDKLETEAHCLEKAIQYVKEDAQIADINYHLQEGGQGT